MCVTGCKGPYTSPYTENLSVIRDSAHAAIEVRVSSETITGLRTDVTKTRNGERGAGSGQRGTGNGSKITSSQRYPP